MQAQRLTNDEMYGLSSFFIAYMSSKRNCYLNLIEDGVLRV